MLFGPFFGCFFVFLRNHCLGLSDSTVSPSCISIRVQLYSQAFQNAVWCTRWKKKWTRVLRVCLPTTHPMQQQRVGQAKFWGVLYHSHMTIEFITQNEMMKVFWRSQGASSHWCKGSSDAVLSWTRSPAHGVTDCIESRNEKLTFSIMAQPRSTKIAAFLHPKPTFWSDAVSCVHGSLQLLASKCCFFSLLFSPKVSLLHSGFGSIGKIQPIWSF